MFHVRQRGLKDCGVAVAAMIAGIPYERVLDRWFGCLTTEDGIREIALARILNDITRLDWQVVYLRGKCPSVRGYRFPDEPSAALIQDDSSTRHYIAVHNGLIFDPAVEGPVPESVYPRRCWWVESIIKPVERLDATRGTKDMLNTV